jgi:hypothetical protein
VERRHSRQSMRGISCVGLLLGAAALLWSPANEAQGTASPALQVQQVQPRAVDRTLEGMRNGVLTRAMDGTAWIDGRTYTLPADVLVENRSGRSLSVKDLRWDDVQYSVDYWLDGNQIIQMVIYFPE